MTEIDAFCKHICNSHRPSHKAKIAKELASQHTGRLQIGHTLGMTRGRHTTKISDVPFLGFVGDNMVVAFY